eukprot:SAG11_NODE_768_length_7269_cov_3.840725_5_plen_192_part_00
MNSTGEPRETSSYTSLLARGANKFVVVYEKRGPPDIVYSMRVTAVPNADRHASLKHDDDTKERGSCPCSPELCKSLAPEHQPPPDRFEVVAYHTAPSYGASPQDWWRVITTVAKFVANDLNLTCHAHLHGARVVDWTGIGGLSPNPANEPWMMVNATARARWIHKAVLYLMSLGLDGAVLDIEGLEDEVDR